VVGCRVSRPTKVLEVQEKDNILFSPRHNSVESRANLKLKRNQRFSKDSLEANGAT